MKNGVMMQYFEWNLPNDGLLWRHLKEDAAHLHEMGITAVWIPPAYKADEQQDEGYATYDLYDLGEFDQKGSVRTKYGTKQELQEAIAALHEHGVSVYLDAVLNHKAGGDRTERMQVVEVSRENRNETIGEPFEIEAWTGFEFPGRGDRYSSFKWHWYHFSGTDYDNLTQRDGIFRIMGNGKAWSDGVDGENGNYDYLMCADIDLDHPEVVEELNRWGKWVAAELELDGMRMDAIKHMKNQFIAQFLDAVRNERGCGFYAVGEYWNNDREALRNYVEAVGHRIDLFDVPLHYNMFQASQEQGGYDLSGILRGTLVEQYPTLAVTFVDNHDSQRGCSLESQIGEWFKPLAYGLILLMKDGYPCLFYADYYGTGGKASPHRRIIDILLHARRHYAYGEQINWFDHPSTIAFARTGDDAHPGSGLVFVMSNDKAGSKAVQLGEDHAGQTWHEITGSIPDEVTLDKAGNGEFRVESRNISVWIRKTEPEP